MSVNPIVVTPLDSLPIGSQQVELVERKGLGHPDTICDQLAEAISHRLCRAYVEHCGRVLHHNIENAFLVAGASTPILGGGTVDAPMRFIFGDHATAEADGNRLPINELAEEAAKRWIRRHLPLVDVERHLVFQNELRAGSVQLTDIFARDAIVSNDTCVGSGYAPLSEVEKLVIAAESYLNSRVFKEEFPETGQDIKVTAVRRDGQLELTLSLAFVSSRVNSEEAYFAAKQAVRAKLHDYLAPQLRSVSDLKIQANTLDCRGRGTAGIYLTVLGTSADSADGGQVGRGNRPSGVNAFHRPAATGAVAGKNPVSNVGKIYNLFSHELAGTIYEQVEGLEEVYVSMCSQIGQPLEKPLVAAVRVIPAKGMQVTELAPSITGIVEREIAVLPAYARRLVNRALVVS